MVVWIAGTWLASPPAVRRVMSRPGVEGSPKLVSVVPSELSRSSSSLLKLGFAAREIIVEPVAGQEDITVGLDGHGAGEGGLDHTAGAESGVEGPVGVEPVEHGAASVEPRHQDVPGGRLDRRRVDQAGVEGRGIARNGRDQDDAIRARPAIRRCRPSHRCSVGSRRRRSHIRARSHCPPKISPVAAVPARTTWSSDWIAAETAVFIVKVLRVTGTVTVPSVP